ncbi:rho GDP-dissociation inhibitor [Vararia minispora EC-137]|uniref:Rho GDP-dissociation inhibitor n=1 Tax=Vararia minispora EC-137 TaxID=1314806 RepID=A0ACB8QPI4_9AGAM|nr:rho GDP-dissociation inhibitor [Vararia minispora EC-137]
MSAPDVHDDELETQNTPGYKPTAAKSLDEYKNLDANDESLARWKASLGISGSASEDTSKPKLTVSYLELTSSTLPAGQTIKVDISNPARIRALKDGKPIQVKEGADYKVYITFNVNHGLVTGARYIHSVKRGPVRLDKTDSMLGSYSAKAEPIRVAVVEDEFPSGMLARSSYTVKSRVQDFDGGIFAEWEWHFKIAKEWQSDN